MTKEEIKNTPELVDFMLDNSVLADARTKVRKRLEEVCDLAIRGLEQEPRKDEVVLTNEEYRKLVSNEFENGYAKGYKEALEGEPVLDEIRAEIERERSFQRAMDEYDIATGLRKALEVIDRYKEESEEKDYDR